MQSYQVNSQNADADRQTAFARALFVGLIATLLMPLCANADSGSGSWRLAGRFQVDAATYDSTNPLFQDDTGVRRGRIALKGSLFDSIDLKIEYELSGSTPGPKSMWVRSDIGKHTALTVGHFKEPFTLQNATSSRYSTFMERALPNVGSHGYRLGAKLSSYGHHWSASTGVTSGGLDENYNVDKEGVGFFVRGVFNPVAKKKRMVHLGFSSEYRTFSGGDFIRFRSRPESDLTDIRLVDTFDLTNLDKSWRYAAEFAWKLQSVHFQAEYIGLNTTRTTAPDLDFSGWYAQAGWFLTGERRKYNRQTGTFSRTRPKRSFGAWEVAVRYSELDLESADIFGGFESNTGVALNWYATDDIRVSLNYIDASARPAVTGLPDDVSIFQARFQYIF